MQEPSPNKSRSARSNGKSSANKSRRSKVSSNKQDAQGTKGLGDTILARLDVLDARLNEALAADASNSDAVDSLQSNAASEQVLEAVVNQGKAISHIAEVLEALRGSFVEMTPPLLNVAPEGTVALDNPEPTTEQATRESHVEAGDTTEAQSWADIKDALMGGFDKEEASDAKTNNTEADTADAVLPDEDILLDYASQADVDKLDEDGLKTLIIDQERIISRLVRRVQQKSRNELQLTPEQLHDCAKNLPDELAVRVETTLKTLDEQARLGELELSLERARISRQLSHLEDTREIIESNARSLGLEIGPEGKLEVTQGLAKRNGTKGRRWLGALGFGD